MAEERELTLSEVLKVRRDKLDKLKQDNKNPFKIVRFDVTHYSKYIRDNFETLEGKDVTMAGRIMSYRDMGKASFCDIQDNEGRIQVYIKKDDVGEEAYKDFKTYDMGDIVGLTGMVFRTKRGEISVHIKTCTLLTKSLQPLPEKFHGLTNTELRYRQRYVDLIVNPQVKKTF